MPSSVKDKELKQTGEPKQPDEPKQITRVQFDFSPEAMQRLDEIRQMAGAATRAEVMRNALRMYAWFITETEPDSTIKIINGNGELTSVFKASLLHDTMKSK